MELSNEQVQKIVDAVIRKLGAVSLSPSVPPMVQLPPEFYQSQREIAERVARLEERFVSVDGRFEQVDKRFEQVDKRFSMLQWSIGLGFTFITVLMSLYNFLG